jgi:hypothetical protein
MSALLLKADIGEHHRDVRFVPKADITANRGSGTSVAKRGAGLQLHRPVSSAAL